MCKLKSPCAYAKCWRQTQGQTTLDTPSTIVVAVFLGGLLVKSTSFVSLCAVINVLIIKNICMFAEWCPLLEFWELCEHAQCTRYMILRYIPYLYCFSEHFASIPFYFVVYSIYVYESMYHS